MRPARKVGIADHIWDAFENMAEAMGSDRDALINQAMFMFARLNGFLESGGAEAGGQARQAPPRAAPPVLSPLSGGRREEPVGLSAAPTGARPRAVEERAPQKLDDDPVRREVAERVLETAAELERLIKGKNDFPIEDEEEEEPQALDDYGPEPEDEVEDDAADEAASLYLMSEGGEMDKIVKERFVIGRGKHCDFVINSGKVSREHAVILRDGHEYFIEDLGSSNGTWFNKQRIKRRKIEDGDEYFVCSEKIKLVMR